MRRSAWPAVPARFLGAQRTPFPVSATYQVRPDLYKLDAAARDTHGHEDALPGARASRTAQDELALDAVGLLRADLAAPRFLREKLALLEDRAHPLVLVAPACDREATEAALRQAIAMLSAAHPELVAVGDDREADGRGVDGRASMIAGSMIAGSMIASMALTSH